MLILILFHYFDFFFTIYLKRLKLSKLHTPNTLHIDILKGYIDIVINFNDSIFCVRKQSIDSNDKYKTVSIRYTCNLLKM